MFSKAIVRRSGKSMVEGITTASLGEFFDHIEHITEPGTVDAGELIEQDKLTGFNAIALSAADAYSANSIWVNDRVLVPLGYTETSRAIAALGYEVIELDVSEFRKIDGGLSCLSLRF